MTESITFDDVLIEPQFSTVKSRKDVSLYNRIHLWGFNLPVISSNMDTITGPEMAIAMDKAGGKGCLHRFWSIDDNVEALLKCPSDTMVSFGLGDREKERVEALALHSGIFCLDVAHGAQQAVVDQVKWFKEKYPHLLLTVGNFASAKSFEDFCDALGNRKLKPDIIKVGIGPGSACTTRIKTGVGVPQITAIQQLTAAARRRHIRLIADGGMRTPGDIAKALAVGADAVMLGGMLAGTTETPGEIFGNKFSSNPTDHYKIYRGSASRESYELQGKVSGWRAAEGESFTVTWKGPVENILKDIEGSLRSAFTYVGASNLLEFQEKAKLTRVTSSGKLESVAHGKERL